MPEQLWENEFENFDCQNPETAEVLNDLLRALRRKKGFGLFFIQCNPAQGTRVIAAIRKRFPQKRLVEFELNRQSETLYGELLEHYQGEKFEIACVTGVEQALYAYEDTKRLAGWSSQEIYNYSWKGLPPLLGHLNRQREAFEANLPIALIFLVPSFAIDYFVQRAPDFFDWRSGFFKFSESQEDLQKACQDLVGKEYEEYLALTSEERIKKNLEIKEKIILLDSSDSEQKSNLLREQGLLFESDGDSIRALDCFDRALKANINNYQAWTSKGKLLDELERYEEAIESYDRALEIKSNFYYAWHNRGITLRRLERYEEAIESHDRALQIKPDAHDIWYNKGIAFRCLEQYEKAIESCDRALQIKPDAHYVWNNRGLALNSLKRYKEAIDSLNNAIEIKPNFHHAWGNRGNVLLNLEQYEEAIESYDRALKLKSNIPIAWINRSVALLNLSKNKEAIESCDRALRIQPDSPETWINRSVALLNLGKNEEAIESCDRALEIQPDYHWAWNSKGLILYQLGKYHEAYNCFEKVAKINTKDEFAWNNQGYLALVQYSYGLQPIFAKPLLIRLIQDCNSCQNILEIDLELCQKSLQQFDTALNLDSTLILAWANQSFPAYYLQQYQLALQNCDKALELDPENEEEMNEVIYTNRGCILLKLHNPTAALKDFTKALEIDPKLDEAWIGHGTALYQLERYPEALGSFTQALNLNHPLAQTNLTLTRQHLES
ncbi:MAG: tetratricopeptide repeat protein [Cyanobacteriota bacterium]|nr:tetratricopeptide repeat protein [Cyanobacteriota bacterium]